MEDGLSGKLLPATTWLTAPELARGRLMILGAVSILMGI